jgi:hypothetical protein
MLCIRYCLQLRKRAETAAHKPALLPYFDDPLARPLSAVGSADRLQAANALCKAQRTTLNAAMVVAMTAALAPNSTMPSHSCGCYGGKDRVALSLSVIANMKIAGRLPPGSVTDSDVGNYACALDPCSPLERGVSLDARFWDLARRVKADTDAQVMRRAALPFVHPCPHTARHGLAPPVQFLKPTRLVAAAVVEVIAAPGMMQRLRPLQDGFVPEAYMSNLGRYSYAEEFSFPQRDGEDARARGRITALHFGTRLHSIRSANLYVSTVGSVPGYLFVCNAIQDAKQAAFRRMVTALECICDVRPEDTLRSVCSRIDEEVAHTAVAAADEKPEGSTQLSPSASHGDIGAIVT